jgi:hypothetical protein
MNYSIGHPRFADAKRGNDGGRTRACKHAPYGFFLRIKYSAKDQRPENR